MMAKNAHKIILKNTKGQNQQGYFDINKYIES